MRRTLLLGILFSCISALHSQNIDDNKVSFQFIQLPLIKIDDSFKTYEIRVNHTYLDANKDSLAKFEINKQVALDLFHHQLKVYQYKRDSMERSYLMQMATWEKQTNAAANNSSASAPIQPNPPVFPEPPLYPNVKAPRIHMDFQETSAKNNIKLAGFKEGLGGCIITLDILPIQNIRIVQTIKGTGSSTKYEYKCHYSLPIRITLESPTQGVLAQQTIADQVRVYNIKDFASQYDYQLYMRENEEKFYADLITYARNEAQSEANDFLNKTFGFVLSTRNNETYSIKKYKNYDYSDVTKAYTKTIQAFTLVKNDRDRSGAKIKLDAAIQAWLEIMEESNMFDDKARINDKISAVFYCNLAELYIWKADFDKADMYINLAINSGVGKAKRHAEDLQGFYTNQRKRWEANY